MKYYIVRTIGDFENTLACLWDGSDLPTFRRDGNPYTFDCIHVARRVLWRLEARYPTTMDTPHIPALPIQYHIEAINTQCEDNQRFAPEQHLACFL